jgi:uncharacterized hydrophobic protein (TIGR00271 family)
MENTTGTFKSVVESVNSFLKGIFNLSKDTDKEATIEEVKAGIRMKGQTAWVLIFSILIASAGLNTSSTAVVIGAMLISPLMGPILGMGLSLGINDIDFLKKALKNFAVMVVLSLFTSFLFFSIPMFQNETPELIARTYPDVRDVIIALSGGLALIIAMSRKTKLFNTIAGVAIATALMPPLCTSGYGLATAKWDFFGGAIFLFSINTVFIASATFAVVRFLKFPYETYADSAQRKMISRVISGLALVILIPSIYMFYRLYKKSDFDLKVDNLVEDVRSRKGIVILDVKKNYTKKLVSFAVVGRSINEKDLIEFKEKMRKSGYGNVNFQILQDVANLETITKIQEIESSYLSTQKLLAKKEEELFEKDRLIFDLQNKLIDKQRKEFPFYQTAEEIKALNRNIIEVSFADRIITNFVASDTVPTFNLLWDKKVKVLEMQNESLKLQNWLRRKNNNDKIVVKFSY